MDDMLINGQCKHGIPIADRCTECYPSINLEYTRQDSEREFQIMLKLITDSNNSIRQEWRAYVEDIRAQFRDYGDPEGEIPGWFRNKFERDVKNGIPEIHINEI
jgi:hypothetical protein